MDQTRCQPFKLGSSSLGNHFQIGKKLFVLKLVGRKKKTCLQAKLLRANQKGLGHQLLADATFTVRLPLVTRADRCAGRVTAPGRPLPSVSQQGPALCLCCLSQAVQYVHANSHTLIHMSSHRHTCSHSHTNTQSHPITLSRTTHAHTHTFAHTHTR